MEVAEIAGRAADAFAEPALRDLATVYDEAQGDLRLVLALADEAVGEALQDESIGLVGRAAVRAARAKRAGLMP